MKYATIMFMMLLSASILNAAIGSGEDYVDFHGQVPKALDNLNQSEIILILGHGDAWMQNIGIESGTISQRKFAEDNPEDGKPIGKPTDKMAYLGSRTSDSDTRVM